MEKSELQKLVDYCWDLVEKEKAFDNEACPNLQKCEDELRKIELMALNYVLYGKE